MLTGRLQCTKSSRESYPTSGGRGGSWEELPCFRGQWQLGGDNPHPRPGAAAGRSHPRSEAHVGEEGLKEPSHLKVRKGGKEIPSSKVMEQRLCFLLEQR